MLAVMRKVILFFILVAFSLISQGQTNDFNSFAGYGMLSSINSPILNEVSAISGGETSRNFHMLTAQVTTKVDSALVMFCASKVTLSKKRQHTNGEYRFQYGSGTIGFGMDLIKRNEALDIVPYGGYNFSVHNIHFNSTIHSRLGHGIDVGIDVRKYFNKFAIHTRMGFETSFFSHKFRSNDLELTENLTSSFNICLGFTKLRK